jgi:hypothetical protein
MLDVGCWMFDVQPPAGAEAASGALYNSRAIWALGVEPCAVGLSIQMVCWGGGRAVTTDSARSGDHRLAVTYAPVAVGRTLMHASGRTLMPDSLGVHPLFDVCSFQTQMVRNRVWGGVTKKYHAKAHPLIGAEIDDHWAGHRPENLLGA